MKQEQNSRVAFVVSAFVWGAGLALGPGHQAVHASLDILRAIVFLFT